MSKITQISVVYATAPFIVVERDNVVTATGTEQLQAEFNELGAWIKLLEQQQALINEYVSFAKGLYTQNNKQFPAVIIAATDQPPIVVNPVDATITLDGNPLVNLNVLSAHPYANATGLSSLETLLPSGIALLKLPVVNIGGLKDVLEDYGFQITDAETYISQYGIANGYYFVALAFAGQPTLIEITRKEHYQVEGDVFYTPGYEVALGFTDDGGYPTTFVECPTEGGCRIKRIAESTQLLVIHSGSFMEQVYIRQLNGIGAVIQTDILTNLVGRIAIDIQPTCNSFEVTPEP